MLDTGRSRPPLVALFLTALFHVNDARGLTTNGLLVDLDAANPGSTTGRWENLAPLGGYLSANAPVPAQRADVAATYFAHTAGSTWGVTPAEGNEPALHIEDWALELWLRRYWNGADEHQIAGLRKTSDHAQRVHVRFADSTSSSVTVEIKGNADADGTFFTNVVDIPVASGWMQFLLTFDDASDVLCAYTNGALHGMHTAAAPIDMDPGQEMKRTSLFASYALEGWRGLNGAISRCRVYDRVLSPAEVADNYASGNTPGISIPGADTLLDPTVTTGTVVNIPAPPSTLRDKETVANSLESVRSLMESRKAIAGGAFQTAQANWMTTQHPDADGATIAALVRQHYADLVGRHVHPPSLYGTEVEHLTLVYPVNYFFTNPVPVTVHTRRLTIRAYDAFGDPRHLVAYYANYDRLPEHDGRVIFQINGHFGTNPSRQGLGIENYGGYSGAALGKIAMQGYPLITYDDHNVGESSGGTSKENGLYQTLANLVMMDDAVMELFAFVDGTGLSGGTERLYHYLLLHDSNLCSAYLGGFATPIWTRMDTAARTGGPFGSDGDTDNEIFQNNFQWADMALAGLDKGMPMAMTHNAYEGGISKHGYFEAIVPALLNHVEPYRFETRGGDRNGDGMSETGRWLAHEYDLVDFFAFMRKVRSGAPAWPLIGLQTPRQIYWYTESNATYQVQWRASLTEGSWQDLGSPVSGEENVLRVTDPDPTPRRFYRTVVQQP